MSEETQDINRLQERWAKLSEIIKERFGKKPDIEGILFLIGVRELGEMPVESVQVCPGQASRAFHASTANRTQQLR